MAERKKMKAKDLKWILNSIPENTELYVDGAKVTKVEFSLNSVGEPLASIKSDRAKAEFVSEFGA